MAVNSYLAMEKAEVSWKEMVDAISDMEKYRLDFVGAPALQTMKRNGAKEIYAIDERLATKIEEVEVETRSKKMLWEYRQYVLGVGRG